MDPITLRLPADLLAELSAEADEHGYSSRSEYIRHVLRNRSSGDPATTPNTAVAGPITSADTTDTGPATSTVDVVALADRVDELDERIAALEGNDGPTSGVQEVESDAPRDPEGATTLSYAAGREPPEEPEEAHDEREEPRDDPDGIDETADTVEVEWPVDAADAPDPNDLDGRVRAVVDRVADGWARDDRRDTRKLAAALVLQHALDSGKHIGPSDPVVEAIREEYPVAGQDDKTWWTQNAREVLQAVTEHTRNKGYRVDPDDLDGGDETDA